MKPLADAVWIVSCDISSEVSTFTGIAGQFFFYGKVAGNSWIQMRLERTVANGQTALPTAMLREFASPVMTLHNWWCMCKDTGKVETISTTVYNSVQLPGSACPLKCFSSCWNCLSSLRDQLSAHVAGGCDCQQHCPCWSPYLKLGAHAMSCNS
jgi:hypothetical protein